MSVRLRIPAIFPAAIPATFVSSYSIDEAVSHLSQGALTSRIRAITSASGLFGQASPERVRLRRLHALSHNAYRPVFRGRFEIRELRTQLVGEFTMQPAVRAFLRFGLAFCHLWSVGALLAMSNQSQSGLPWWFPLSGLGMAAMIIAFARVAWLTSRDDVEWISTRIRELIS